MQWMTILRHERIAGENWGWGFNKKSNLYRSTSDFVSIAPNLCRTINRRDAETGISMAFSMKRSSLNKSGIRWAGLRHWSTNRSYCTYSLGSQRMQQSQTETEIYSKEASCLIDPPDICGIAKYLWYRARYLRKITTPTMVIVTFIWQKLNSIERRVTLIVSDFWQLFPHIFGETLLIVTHIWRNSFCFPNFNNKVFCRLRPLW